MTAADVIEALGGNKAVQKLTGLSKGRISQWRTENHIPALWLRVLRREKPAAFRKNGRTRERRAAAVGA